MLRKLRAAGPGRARAARRALAPLLSLAAVCACGGMPTTGTVQSESRQSVDQNASQVQVFPQPPYSGERPEQIVDGFLEALVSSGPANDATARSYLTPQAAASWKPPRGAQIVETLNSPAPGSEVDGNATVDLSVTPVAYLDAARGGYTPAGSQQPESITFQLRQLPSGWRISAAPDQLVVSELDFTRIFQPVDLYYASALPGHSILIPDRIYLPDNAGTAQAAVSTLLAGPGAQPASQWWLGPGVDPALVAAAGKLTVVSVQAQGAARVTLGGATAALTSAEGTELAAEIYWTLAKLSSVVLDSITLQDTSGNVIATGDQASMERFDPDALPSSTTSYLLQPIGKNPAAGDLLHSSNPAEPVPAGFGDGTFALRSTPGSAAVSPDGTWAAGVSVDGRTLAVQSLVSAAKPVTVLTGTNLSEPSWDASGDLWVVDQTPTGPVVHELLNVAHAVDVGHMSPDDVTTVAVDAQPFTTPDGPQLSAPFQVTKLRVATDGTRVLVVASLPGGRSQLLLGVLTPTTGTGLSGTGPSGTGPAGTGLRLTNLRPIMPQLSSVADAAWDGPRVLAVLGAGQPGQQAEPYLVDLDGGSTQTFTSWPAGLVCIAAAHPDLPNPLPVLVSDGAGALYEFSPGTSTIWTRVGDATCPLYPA